ncbi:autophagy protein 16 (ATG16) domain-containing protein [Sarocladium implicatum]|nr:autophagy protein 16 (ATG16) domain-containing protein [Sarocladium implicatum]
MPNWREEYLSSFQEAELRHPVNMELVQACSQMADRISALEAEKAALEVQVASSGSKASPAPASELSKDDPGVAQLRLDLAETLRSKGVSETRLRAAEEELAKLRVKTKGDTRSLRGLEADVTSLTTRLKDREHELREKRKLVEDVQDEMITLNLQLSVAEKERDKVKADNKDLVDRWMQYKAQEADAMNMANEPRDHRGR